MAFRKGGKYGLLNIQAHLEETLTIFGFLGTFLVEVNISLDGTSFHHCILCT
jgi:hypothetical protein